MSPLPFWGLLLLCLALGGWAAWFSLRGLRFRQNINQLLAVGEVDEATLLRVADTLSSVNHRGSAYTFGVRRAAKVPFRGRQVCLVFGDVGSISPGEFGEGGWSRRGSLYALAECQDQADWMNANSDVFSPVAADSTFPVFWVKLSALMANQHLQPSA